MVSELAATNNANGKTSTQHSSDVESSEEKYNGVEEIPIDTEAERRLRRKLDLRVVPPTCVLFLLSFLDRVNIGNARIQFLERDLNMKGNQFNIALLIIFIPFVLFEVPSNLVMKKVKPSIWLSTLLFGCGIMTICLGVVESYAALVACRFLLGIFEAGVGPGSVYLISMYYKRYELPFRLSWWYCSAIIAGAFGGLLAYGLAHMDGIQGYSGWRWIFIIEGLVSVVVSIPMFWWMVDWPETATFLNEEERALLLRRLREDKNSGVAQMSRLDKTALKRIASDWKIYVATLIYFGVVNLNYSTNFFIPTILKQLGWTSETAQVRSIPIYVVAAACCLATCWLSDRFQNRYTFIMIGVGVGSIGLIILLCASHVRIPVRYMAIFFVTSSGYIVQPVAVAWLANNMGGHYKRSWASGFQIGVGNLGGVVASNIFVTTEAPKFRTGYGTTLGLLLFAGVMATVLVLGLGYENKKRAKGGFDHRLALPEEEVNNLGDAHPRFRFSY